MVAWSKEKADAFRQSFLEFCRFFPISSKESGQVMLGDHLYRAQHRFLDAVFDGLTEDIHDFYVLKSRQLGLCLDPSTRVLTADLRWVPIGEISVGTEIVAVDEVRPARGMGERKMRTAVVEGVHRTKQWAYEISFDDGRKLICSDHHRWLSKCSGSASDWRAIKPTKKNGRRTRFKLTPGTQIRWITRPWGEPTIEDGWFGGMLDGEGSKSNEKRSGASVNVSQRRGAVWDRLVNYAFCRGYSSIVENDDTPRLTKFGKEPVPKLCFNRMDEIFRLLGTTRPTRFMGWRFWENRSLPGKNSGIGWATIKDIKLVGERELVDLQTSTGTFVAEGFVSHNSTVTRGLSLFWLGMHSGLRGGMVFDSAFNTAGSRQEIVEALENMPPHLHFPEIRKGGSNRDRMILENDSWITFMQAGTKNSKTGGGLGRSQGLNLIHASELCSWVNEEGVTSFRNSLAEKYPDRLYIWESTGRGYNIWYNIWQQAKNDPYTKRTVFIGWWAKDNQVIEMDDPLFSVYGQDAPNARERDRIAAVRELYDWQITQGQLAWYRWKIDPSRELDEDDPEDTNAVQEQPFTEEECFQATGSQFFISDKLTAASLYISKEAPKPTLYKFWPGMDFVTCDCRKATTRREIELTMWEEPVSDSVYVLSADPAFGHDENNNNSAAQVLRCYADGVDQVAEYASPNIQPHHFAWLLWTLAGYYGSKPNSQVMVIGELNGPGEEVYRQFQATRQIVQQGYLRQAAREKGISDIFTNMRNYLYSRSDSIHGSSNSAWWKTSLQNKVQIMEACRNYLHNGLLRVYSMELVEEMRTITRDGDSIGAEGSNRDDRTFALALGIRAWDERLRRGLIAGNRTREAERAKQSLTMEDQYNLFRNNQLQAFFKTKQLARQQQHLASMRMGWRTGVGTHRILPGRR